MKWLAVALMTAAAAFAAGQNLPEGDGKALITGQCGSCHGLDLITAKKASRNDWVGVVDRMKSYGSNLTDPQTTTVIDYLAKNFGTGAPAPAAAPAQGGGAGDTEAKALVNGVCASCHGADLITSKKADKAEWQEIGRAHF